MSVHEGCSARLTINYTYTGVKFGVKLALFHSIWLTIQLICSKLGERKRNAFCVLCSRESISVCVLRGSVAKGLWALFRLAFAHASDYSFLLWCSVSPSGMCIYSNLAILYTILYINMCSGFFLSSLSVLF